MEKSNFQSSYRKSKSIFQYCCSCRTGNYWWGSVKNKTCNRCKKEATKLPLQKMIGIGWFQCTCGRRYAGFCRGDVMSKCHGCQKKNLPRFIVPVEKDDKREGSDKKHHCEQCKGDYDCPIVAMLKRD